MEQNEELVMNKKQISGTSKDDQQRSDYANAVGSTSDNSSRDKDHEQHDESSIYKVQDYVSLSFMKHMNSNLQYQSYNQPNSHQYHKYKQ